MYQERPVVWLVSSEPLPSSDIRRGLFRASGRMPRNRNAPRVAQHHANYVASPISLNGTILSVWKQWMVCRTPLEKARS